MSVGSASKSSNSGRGVGSVDAMEQGRDEHLLRRAPELRCRALQVTVDLVVSIEGSGEKLGFVS